MHQEAIKELDRKGLREFGLVTGAIVAVLFGLFFPWVFDSATPRWPFVLAGILGAWGLLAPLSLRPVYRVWMKFGLLMSRVTTPLVLGVVFFLVILPIGLVMRIGGRDPMNRAMNDDSETYRVPGRKRPRSAMERPF